MKPYGNLYANPSDIDNPLVYIPADGSSAEIVTLVNLPDNVRDTISKQADALELVPLGMIIDFKGAV